MRYGFNEYADMAKVNTPQPLSNAPAISAMSEVMILFFEKLLATYRPRVNLF